MTYRVWEIRLELNTGPRLAGVPLFGVPWPTIRENTERPIVVAQGTNALER